MSRLFYVIGASGAGKDTLINYARTKINGLQPVIFAHRYITRPPFTGNENHISLSSEEFQSRIKANLFALYWESHGNFYGIGHEGALPRSLQIRGGDVVANDTRS